MSSAALEPRWQRRSLIAGAVGLGLWLLAAFVSDLGQLLRGYLVAWSFCLSIALGSLAIAMLHQLTGGAWGVLLRWPLDAGMRTLPLLGMLFLPLALGVTTLYTWAQPAVVAGDPLLQHRSSYLNVPFFLGRAVIYFLIWLTLAWLLTERSAAAGADAPRARRIRRLSAIGLGLYGLSVSFAAIDWLMSLEPHWQSSVYGALVGVGQVLAALAFATAVMLLTATPPLVDVLKPNYLRDLGSLLLAFVMIWAYLAFSQFLLIWSADLPEETPWHARRAQGGWQVVGVALVLLHFALPFVLLLARQVKTRRRALATVAGLVVVMRLVDLYWLVAPTADATLSIHWVDLCALVGVLGLWLGVYLWFLGRQPTLTTAEADMLRE